MSLIICNNLRIRKSKYCICIKSSYLLYLLTYEKMLLESNPRFILELICFDKSVTDIFSIYRKDLIFINDIGMYKIRLQINNMDLPKNG